MEKKQPVKVLCMYRAWARVGRNTITFYDSIMIVVEKSSDIDEKFHLEMNRRYHSKKQSNPYQVGPTPTAFELTEYIPENGMRTFNLYRN